MKPCGAEHDAGRLNEGVVSCPNGISDSTRPRPLGDDPGYVVSFGYPPRPRDPERRSADEWSARAKRLPLDERVARVKRAGPPPAPAPSP